MTIRNFDDCGLSPQIALDFECNHHYKTKITDIDRKQQIICFKKEKKIYFYNTVKTLYNLIG